MTIPRGTQTLPIELHELHNLDEDDHDVVAIYAYGHYTPIVFATAVSRYTKEIFTEKDVRHCHVQEVEVEGGIATKQCTPLEFGSVLITLIEL